MEFKFKLITTHKISVKFHFNSKIHKGERKKEDEKMLKVLNLPPHKLCKFHRNCRKFRKGKVLLGEL